MKGEILAKEQIVKRIFYLRGEKVLLDSDLAELYGVSTKRLNEQVRRNISRFPSDFMFQLTLEETQFLRSQFATLNEEQNLFKNQGVENLRSQIATSSQKHGGRRYVPLAFTERGVAMLSSVLNSERAIQVNIEIMRAFVQLREMLSAHQELAKRLGKMEKKYDYQFKVVFTAIEALMTPDPPKKSRFH